MNRTLSRVRFSDIITLNMPSGSLSCRAGNGGLFTIDYVIIALLAVCIILLVVLVTKKPAGGDTTEIREGLAVTRQLLEQNTRSAADEFERSRRESARVQGEMRQETSASLGEMTKKLEEMRTANFEHQKQLTAALNVSLETIRTNNTEQNERLSRAVSDSMAKMQESNEKRLDLMRETVDEKLNATLAARLDSSFKTVSEQLENVNKSLGEMKELSGNVTGNITALNRVLTNVKARGTWAEVQLEGILDQTIPLMYVKNFAPGGGSERVEFAIKIPSGEDTSRITYLPVDSKFPLEDYSRLCDAADRADAEGVKTARAELDRRILSEAKSVSKYINPPVTTPYAIMYLATEGLYAEIVARPGLPEKIQSEFSVMLAGPTTITALLTSLSMGFKAVAINEKANEVRRLLSAARAQYDKFGTVLDKARKKIEEAGSALGEAQDRNRIITKKLKSVEEISPDAAEQILGDGETD